MRVRRLLSHLAQFSSFSNQGELLCTQGLAYLLGRIGMRVRHSRAGRVRWAGARSTASPPCAGCWVRPLGCSAVEHSRRGRAHLVEPNESADSHFATPLPATPGEALGQSVNLIVVADREKRATQRQILPAIGRAGEDEPILRRTGRSGQSIERAYQCRAYRS